MKKQERPIVTTENLALRVQNTLAELTSLLEELDKHEEVWYEFFDDGGDLISVPKTINIHKTWSM